MTPPPVVVKSSRPALTVPVRAIPPVPADIVTLAVPVFSEPLNVRLPAAVKPLMVLSPAVNRTLPLLVLMKTPLSIVRLLPARSVRVLPGMVPPRKIDALTSRLWTACSSTFPVKLSITKFSIVSGVLVRPSLARTVPLLVWKLLSSVPWPSVLITVRSKGSSRIVPGMPIGAETLIDPVNENPWLPDTSTNPPSPPCGPPMAAMVPAMLVDVVDRTVTRPPSPFPRALAAIVAPACTVTLAAVRFAVTPGPPAARFNVVPIATRPPPVWPEASIRAPDATVTLPFVLTSILPPFVPAATPIASNWPTTVIAPPIPSSVTVPARLPTLFA